MKQLNLFKTERSDSFTFDTDTYIYTVEVEPELGIAIMVSEKTNCFLMHTILIPSIDEFDDVVENLVSIRNALEM